MTQQLNPRQIAILAHIRQNGRVLVDNLSDMFHATPQTIRRDLQILADAGEIMRFHGGASLPAGIEYTGFDIRRTIALEQKEAIARAIATRIPDKTLLMMNGGTTTAAVAGALKNHSGLRIVVDSVNIANELRHYPGIEVIVPGGTLRRSDGAILGEWAIEFIRQFRVDIAIIGAAAIDETGALLDYDPGEVHVTRAMMSIAKHVILAADSSKYARSAPVCIGQLGQVHTLVSDEGAPRELQRLCRDNEVELIRAQP